VQGQGLAELTAALARLTIDAGNAANNEGPEAA
jgi:hypothetical protein